MMHVIPQIRELGYKVVVLNAASVESVYKDIGIVGNATGTANKANEIITNLRSEISVITGKNRGSGHN